MLNEDFFRKRVGGHGVCFNVPSLLEYPGREFYQNISTRSEYAALPSRAIQTPLISIRQISQFMYPVDSSMKNSKCERSKPCDQLKLTESKIHFIFGPSGSGKTNAAFDFVKSRGLELVLIHPEDFITNNQIFTHALAKISGHRTRNDFFNKKRSRSIDCLILVDELEVAIYTENTSFLTHLIKFLEVAVDTTVVITSEVHISHIPQMHAIKDSLLFESVLGEISIDYKFVRLEYSIALNRFCNEWDMNYICITELQNYRIMSNIKNIKRKSAFRNHRAIPSCWSAIMPNVRDGLLELYHYDLNKGQ